MLLNQKQIKMYARGLNKRISKDAINCLDERVAVILTRSSRNANNKKTIIRNDILLQK
jgi:hypothetical protein